MTKANFSPCVNGIDSSLIQPFDSERKKERERKRKRRMRMLESRIGGSKTSGR